ncbi:hypothetical protein EJ02DRAFT_253729 [Clathrospora elynae]|uniref:SH3 domain-containing protein n=1 Tax=Clathrospora elynae TaxID=706981 RepID=A0A6A5SR47_9PLEO|nr:hypothetical protein EJ02DRAFT_253729 [Clathrospora elynae]
MAHQHVHAHLVRRQRFRDQDDQGDQGDQGDDSTPPPPVAVVVVTEIVSAQTEAQTEAPSSKGQALLAPATRARESDQSSAVDEPKQTSKPVETSKKPSATQQTDAEETAIPKTTIKNATTLMVETKSPTPKPQSAAAGIASATAAISATASSSASAEATEGGISAGAKAGLALGILLVVCALLTGILLVYRRKKKAMAATAQENEKTEMYNAPAPPPPQAMAAAPPAPSIRSMSTAPQLSLRPVTQFDPTFNEKPKSGGNLLIVAAAGSADRPTSAWERRGAANAPATNPFNDPETRSGPPSANPFGNHAAVDARHASNPDSPLNASLMHSTRPSNDFANPASAIAAASIDPVAMAGAMSSFPALTNERRPLPAMAANATIVPPSPSWTEDIPASPGPAPTGPPPVAGAMAGGRPQSPGPGPNNVHRVQLDFKPSMKDELDLHAGQLVRMLHEYDDGWALCIRMDRSQQGVVPRTCLSKHPVKPRQGPPPPGGMRGPPMRSPMGSGGMPQPRPLSPASGSNSPRPSGPMSPSQRSMSPGPRQMSPKQMQGPPGARGNSNAPQHGPPRGRSNSNAPYAGPPRSMSPGPYGGGPQMAPPPQMGRPRANSANQASNPRRGPVAGPSPMNPNAGLAPMPIRKPVPGMAL